MDEINSNDKLLAALAYIFSPLVPIILMLLEDKKNNPFIKAHNAQALVVGLIFMVINIALSWTCVVPLVTLGILIYWGYQAYQGQDVVIPVITDFVRNQGWA
jgi:uncharacterized membrane protein